MAQQFLAQPNFSPGRRMGSVLLLLVLVLRPQGLFGKVVT